MIYTNLGHGLEKVGGNDEAFGMAGADGRVTQGIGEKALTGTSRSTLGGCRYLCGNSDGKTAPLSAPFACPAPGPATRHGDDRRHRFPSTTTTLTNTLATAGQHTCSQLA